MIKFVDLETMDDFFKNIKSYIDKNIGTCGIYYKELIYPLPRKKVKNDDDLDKPLYQTVNIEYLDGTMAQIHFEIPRIKKILHFEDDEFLAELYKVKFEQNGFNIQHYSYPPCDKSELIQLIIAEKPDLIIMDIIMPNIDGFEATKILKADKSTKKIPIIGFDNLSQPDEIQKAKDFGMTDYLIKAYFMPSEVIKRIREYLNDPKKYVPIYNLEIIQVKGEKIYKEKLRKFLEKDHWGEFVALEVESEKYFLGKSLEEATEIAKKEFPDRIFHIVRVGYVGAHRLTL